MIEVLIYTLAALIALRGMTTSSKNVRNLL